MPDPDRLAEVKARQEAKKKEVRILQDSLTDLKAAASGSHPPVPGAWQKYHAAKKAWLKAVNELGEIKTELQQLSGTTGADPRWKLIYEAYHVLSGLEEAGVDIGDRGHALIEEIEFQVPTAKLHNHSEERSHG